MTKKLILTILDGWGQATSHPETNAIEHGKTPFWHSLLKDYPNANLITFGNEVGLPEGQMGNSEVGHTNIGAGRIVFQELPKINNAIKDESLSKNTIINKAIEKLKASKKAIHIMGLFSDGGVHAHYKHITYIAELFGKSGITTWLHLFTDGRDTPPSSAIKYIKELESLLNKYPNVKIATVSGRYYSMDRDNRWERVTLSYNAIVSANGEKYPSAKDIVEKSYENKVTDEFIIPAIVQEYDGMNDGDSIFMVNFRADRARQILDALILPDFNKMERSKIIKFDDKIAMTSYSDILVKYMSVVFPQHELKNTLGEWLSALKLNQLRIAETEKYPHVTFFFSGGKEQPFDNEERILIPSPKVATYDLKPEMSACEITDNLEKALKSKKFDFIVVNYANGDMVGHTGNLEAASKAAETVDNCLIRLAKAIKDNDYIWLIIADHGNCETMWDYVNNVPHTQHTTNLVKVTLVNHSGSLNDGKLADVAPTILELMELEIPKEMTGESILKK